MLVVLGHEGDELTRATFTASTSFWGELRPPPAEAPTSEETKRSWILLMESWDDRRVWKIYGRRAFVDASGRPGLAPRQTSPGDVIALFRGGQVPVMLREMNNEVNGY